jgi:hypothetical protein
MSEMRTLRPSDEKRIYQYRCRSMSTSVDVEQTDHTDHKGSRVQLAKGADIGDDTAIAGNRVAGWYLPQSSLG